MQKPRPPVFMRLVLWGLAGLLALLILGAGYYVWQTRQSAGPTILRVAAGLPGSDSFNLMGEVANVVSRHSTSLRLEIVPSRNASENIALISRGQVDVATVRDYTPAPEAVRMIANLFPDYFYIVARADSAVRRVEDLGDARVLVPSFGGDAYMAFWQVADHYDLYPEALNWRSHDFKAATKRLLDGDADVLFNISSLRDEGLLNLVYLAGLRNVPLRFVPIDQAAAMRLKRPLLHAGTIVKGAVDGQVRLPTVDVPTVSTQRLLVAHADVPAALMEELTRILFEYRLDLVLRTPLAAEIAEPDRHSGFRIPLHEGAGWFFDRDKPGFLEQNAELLSFYIAAAAVVWSALLALRSQLNARRKNRADNFNQRLIAIANDVRGVREIEGLRAIKSQHESVLEDMVDALDNDRVTAEGFQSFSLLWESVGHMISDKMAGLQTGH